MGVSMLVIASITFGSNVFVDPATMPGWSQGFVEVNPFSHLITAERGLMAAVPVGSEVVTVLVWCAVRVGVFGTLTMRRYGQAR